MGKNFKKLRELLEEMFQLDQADLDFGIYRIMNYKRKEIEKFLAQDLLPQVKKELEKYISVKQESLVKEMEDLKKTLDASGVVYKQSAKYVALKNQIANGLSVEQAESEVYSHLANFFKRYYDNGDFISARRYKEGVYAIPYEGEEVKIYWANADQYYIKTTEYFRDYSFKLPNEKIVHFKLVEADTEKDNNKAQKDKERRFVISKEEPFKIKDGELYIQFEYKIDNKKQDKLISEAMDLIRLYIKGGGDYASFIEVYIPSPTEKNPERTLIEKHLNDYTARNTFDYFIHKDLGGFLRRELDFYLKNEVMFLDDLNTERERRVEEYIAKIKVIKSLGHKIIEFLAQIEDFQKKLWLKKKFVVQTDYCMTLNKIDESFYPEIVNNKKQIAEWKELFAIDEIEGYAESLRVEFLKENPYLVLDTAFYNKDFKEKLLESIDNIDENTDGLLIHSENFQALNLLQEKYKENIDGIYIDPPYNSKGNEIIYKNGYKDSSWASLMRDRLALSKSMLKKDSTICTLIDECEVSILSLILKQVFNEYDIRPVIIEYNHRGRAKSNFSITHEYALWMIPEGKDLITRQKNISEDIQRNLRRTGTDSTRQSTPKMFYGIEVNKNTLEIINVTEALDVNEEIPIHTNEKTVMVWPIDDEGVERRWYYGIDRVRNEAKAGTVWAKEIAGKIQIHYFQPGKEKIRKSLWTGSALDSSTYGSELLNDIFGLGKSEFSYPKSINAVRESLESMTYEKDVFYFDYFAGSGTTGHAVIDLNRKDSGNRKYILVEMGEYFNTVLKPRIQKVIYSKDWKNGKPVSREGSNHIFKYIKLESYDDTLNNLSFKEDEIRENIFEQYDLHPKHIYDLPCQLFALLYAG